MRSIEEKLRSREYMARELIYIEFIGRRWRWIQRLVTFMRPHYCSICERGSYCRRLYANGHIRNMILRGEVCPDAKTFWEIL